MYPVLLTAHSYVRWFVLISLIAAIVVAFRSVSGKSRFTPAANALRHWTATFAHIQMTFGMILYLYSPIVKDLAVNKADLAHDQAFFFRYFHAGMMLIAVIVLTIGSAKVKRLESDQQKYQTMLRWFSAALLLIFLAIPWYFSPLVSRPYFRIF